MVGFTAEDIAQDLGVTNTAVRIRLLRLRRAVRRHLTPPAARQDPEMAVRNVA